MTVFKVKAGDKISAESFNRITDAVNPGVGAMDSEATEKRINASWKNCGETEVPAGSVVTCRLRYSSDPVKAKIRFLNDGFCLEGPVETDRKVYPTATLLKTARPGKIVPCMIEGIVAGLVRCETEEGDDPETPQTAGACSVDENGCCFSSAAGGFDVLDASMIGLINSRYYCFCLLRAAARIGDCLIENDSSTVIKAGDLCAIHALADDYFTTQEAVEDWLKNGIHGKAKMIGNISEENSARLIRCVSLGEIGYGERCRAQSIGSAFCALVWRDPDEFNELEGFSARADWKTITIGGVNVRRLACVRYSGDYAIVNATRHDEQNNIFALMTQTMPGHITTTISSVNIPGNKVVLQSGISASFPIGEITDDLVGKKVIVSRGAISRRWEVIAVCE